MAERSVVLNDVLCFIRHKFGKIAHRQLRSTLMDFYSVEVVSTAKCVLIKDIEAMNLSVKLPHVPARRDGENRTAREVDDIIVLFYPLR